jgi:signal transduction histidine kinase
VEPSAVVRQDAVAPLWRALAVFRVVALGYATIVFAVSLDGYRRPLLGWLVLGLMLAWSLFVSAAFRDPAGRTTLLLVLDLGVAVAALLSTLAVDDAGRIASGALTLPSIWVAGAVLSWALAWGWRGGLVAAAVLGVADLVERQAVAGPTVHNIVLLALGGGMIGYAVDLIQESEERLARALRLEAATTERDRLARAVHDGVLQVLALVQRAGGTVDPALAQLAGEQEVALRGLVSQTRPAEVSSPTDSDLRVLLLAMAGPRSTVSAPATAVLLPARTAAELAAAVEAALDNVRRHAGAEAHAWVLVEDEGEHVVVSVRDDGVGMADGRLVDAVAAGRLGMSQSIRARVQELGGEVSVLSVPGTGTELELRVPRVPTGRRRRTS